MVMMNTTGVQQTGRRTQHTFKPGSAELDTDCDAEVLDTRQVIIITLLSLSFKFETFFLLGSRKNFL